jgi:hypothetical protein
VVEPVNVFLKLVMKLWDARERLLTQEFLLEMSEKVLGNGVVAEDSFHGNA